jgi:2-keto-3-deoxy-L-rhamnonate aldolase RhmA
MLAEQRTVIGTIVNFNSAWFVDLCGSMGFDFVMIDCEHGPMGPESVEMMIRAAEAAGISSIVRVPANVPHEILRYLDIGARGVQIPHVDSAAEAKAAVDAVRYPPVGKRGLAPITRAAGYGATMKVADYVDLANREVLVLPMIETAEAVAAVDAILDVPGIDAIIIGPGDLAASMGHRGNREVPEVKEAVAHVVARCKARHMPVALTGATPDAVRNCIQQGANIVLVGTAAWLLQAGRDFLGAVRQPK